MVNKDIIFDLINDDLDIELPELESDESLEDEED
jgi:hypothetical protein